MTTIISGTNRPNSYSLKLALIIKSFFDQNNFPSSVLSLCDLPDSLASTDMFGKRSDAFKPIQELIKSSDKFLFILPEYNGSYPGIAKLFIDSLDFPGSFKNKKAALIGLASGKYGNIRGIDHFTGVCHYLGLNVLPLKLHVPGIREEISADGSLSKEDTQKFMHELVDQFIAF